MDEKLENLDKTEKDTKYSRGFVQAIAILILVLVVATLFGFHPQELWSEYLAPWLMFIWGIIVMLVEFLASIIIRTVKGVGLIWDLAVSFIDK